MFYSTKLLVNLHLGPGYSTAYFDPMFVELSALSWRSRRLLLFCNAKSASSSRKRVTTNNIGV
jgi:hypothetical protein